MNLKKRAKELTSQMTLAEKCSQMQHTAPAIERLGIPAYNWWNEGLHGIGRSGTATVFPQSIALAATFNPDLTAGAAAITSAEARAKYNEFSKFGETLIYQGLTIWAPNINIFRDPRWGRGHETYGEDPLLTAVMGTAYVHGLQGDDPIYRKADATLKHYAVHSGPEDIRHEFNALVNEKDLHETYLWAFAYCIKHAKPAAVMGAYNRINGEPACASKTYLKEMLFQELGFDGYVVSDCGAICDIDQHHHITANTMESAALAVNNGCILNCGEAYKYLKAAVTERLVSEDTITAAVEKLMETRLRLGMFDEGCPYHNIDYDVIDCENHRHYNRKAAQESIVLLKNNNILPIQNTAKIAIIGPNADSKSVLLGNYNGTPSAYSTILSGICRQAESQNIKTYYARGCHLYDSTFYSWKEQPLREAVIAAGKSDLVILCMGLDPSIEGEEGDNFNGDVAGDKKDIELPVSQKELLRAVAGAGKPIVFLNISGSCVNLTEADHLCDAVVQIFYPGAEGGNAAADILFGTCNPSGRLPVTFYGDNTALPDFTDYSMANRTYQYYPGKPLYPFGYGLSYSDISLADVSAESDGYRITLRNKSHRGGYQLVKIYAKDSRNPSLNKRLVGFKKFYVEGNSILKDFILINTDRLNTFSCLDTVSTWCEV